MIAVNELVARAYESINMTGLGESTDGTMAEVGFLLPEPTFYMSE